MFDSLLTTASFIGPIRTKADTKKLQEDLAKLEHWADTVYEIQPIQMVCPPSEETPG